MKPNRFAFLCFFALTASVAVAQAGPKLKADFSNVVNFKSSGKVVALDKEMISKLRRNLFLVTPSDAIQPYHVIGENDYANFPSIITTDNILQLYHIYFDSILRHTEEHHLIYDARRLASEMLRLSLADIQHAVNSKVRTAAESNAAYFAVASQLLGDTAKIPDSLQGRVTNELALINRASGPHASRIVPYDLDYSQFIVRGHYTRSDELKQYFRAMMWFGLVPFATEKRTYNHVEPTLDTIRQAALMVSDLYSGQAIQSWNRIYSTTSLFVGGSNSLTPPAMVPSLKSTVGWPVDQAKLANDKSVVQLGKAMKRIAKPSIVTKDDRDTVANNAEFRLMGQRAIPDSIVFNRVTDIYKRPWPSPLDVMATLGSSRAANLLDKNPGAFNPQGWSKYRSIRRKLTSQFEAWTSADWGKNLYNQSLNLIRLNLQEPTGQMPRFMHSDAWADKSLTSSSAFWADLRHDTLLYGLQTGAEMGDGEEQPFVKGYVEPKTAIYRQVAASLKQMRSVLKPAGYLSSDDSSEFDQFLDLLSFLQSVSFRELHNVKLSKDEHWRIRRLEGDLSSINTRIQLLGEKYQTLNEDDEDMAIAADVHTARDQAMTVAVGHADDLIAVVPIEGQLFLARGGVLSFYEFKVPVSERLTDHQWKNRVRNHELPSRPIWMKSYFVNRSSRAPQK